MRAVFILLVLAYISSVSIAQDPQPKGGKNIICYVNAGSAKRKAPFNFTPENLDPFLCTHLVYAFAVFGRNYDFDENDDFKAFHSRLIAMKQLNPDLKIMIKPKPMVGEGGWSDVSTGFAEIISNQTTREKFAESLVSFLRKNDFEGIDLDLTRYWLHSSGTIKEGGKPEAEKFVLLAQTIRKYFDNDAEKTKEPRHILAISVTQIKEALPLYDIASLNKYADFLLIMSYVYILSHTDKVRHHAPLFATSEEEKTFNIDYTVNRFLEQADAEKLVLGFPPYGRTIKLVDPKETDIGAKADGTGINGTYTKRDGFLAYYEICLKIKNENWTVAPTKPQGVVGPHAFKDDQWVGYDDVEMVRTKTRYAKNKGLGGVMIWTLDTDDFADVACGQGKYPLANAVKDELNKNPNENEKKI